jgi:carboxylate-amine ligase
LQRGRAINAWLEDLPRQRVVPDEVLRSSVFVPPAPYARGSYPVRIYGPDVVHLGGGEYVVLEDNVRSPSGVAYAEAIRSAGRSAFGEAYARYAPEAVAPYYDVLRATLEAAAPAGEEPSVAVLTRGPDDPAFFEHRRISEACGLRLLCPGDAVVEGGALVAREDGRAFNVAYRRLDEEFLEGAFPGLMRLFEEGGIALSNAPGVGIADDKGVFPHVPDMIRHYLGEEPLLRNAHTYPLAEPEGRAEVLDRLDELVLKPREGYGGHGVLVGPEASSEELRGAAREVQESPEGFIAQKTLDFSTHVLDGWFLGNGGDEAFVDLRAFVLPEAGHVLPGGLTRVARPGTRVVNSSSGGSFKDTWVLGDPRLCRP